MAEKGLVEIINNQIDTEFSEDISMQELQEKLVVFINHLIQNDFQKLVAILYKIDVNEDKLKRILREQAGRDAAEIIATLIIERQAQKIETRKQFGNKK